MRLVLVVLCAAACSGSSRTRTHAEDGLDLGSSDASQSSSSTECYDPAVEEMVVPGTSSVDSCAVWNSLAQMMGDVTIAASGSTLTMTFGSNGVVFTGTVDSSGNVTLVYTHLHDFTDGCEWRATETLTGTLSQASCMLSLSYSYAESVEVSNGACDTPCSGDGTFTFGLAPIQ